MKLLAPPPVDVPRRILIIQLRRIGDTLLGTPAVRALKAKFPKAEIHFAAEEPAHEVLLGHPGIDRVLVAPRQGLLSGSRLLAGGCAKNKYDWAIDFLSNPRSAQYCRVSGAPVRVGLNRSGRSYAYTHLIDEEQSDLDVYAAAWRLRLLELLGVPSRGLGLEIYCDRIETVEAARGAAVVEDLAGPVAAIGVGSHNRAKRLSLEEHCRVDCQASPTAGVNCVLTSGPGECALAEGVLEHLPSLPAVLRNARVPTLAGLYRKCDVYVGPDSGPKHVAAACGLTYGHHLRPGQTLRLER